ncbi:2b9a247b-e208-4d70-9f52-29c7cf793885 [Sclerotinia trifoliorum]|uniref:2b9a247b-e208-4d70-9f52-29c7cf793885 n=1 Tax=Sclerotinia trifoliorum TaxID=28548 RepID=A0A8H2VSG8_9HELO|nr:2b9a247b-e208-4d70-9f52-29c7cf793885 [Sclerotinia trifoliorum]
MGDFYGLSSQEWATAVDDVPWGLKSYEFEDWVWRREGLQDSRLFSHRPNIFLCYSIFPAFDDLPHKREKNSNLYEDVGTSTCRPQRHWCFLGEIVEFKRRGSIKILIEDIDGTKVELILNTDARAKSPALTQLRKGHTVAVLYAQRCGDDCKPEISLQNAALLQIFPISLHNLIALEDVAQEFSTKRETANTRICHAGGKKSASMAKCGRCSFFWYCNQSCQKAGWNKKGHKNDCKFLSEPNLRGMFVMKWDEFNGVVQVPLAVDGIR